MTLSLISLKIQNVVVNGRVTPLFDNFTSISPKGKAVVDYIMVYQDCLDLCTEFRDITPNDLLESNEPACFKLLGDRCKVPDHSLLLLKFKANVCVRGTPIVQSPEAVNKCRRPRVFPENFLSSELCCTALLEMIRNFEACRDNREDLDLGYESLCSVLYAELDRLSPPKSSALGKKSGHKGKPFWNCELNTLWADVRGAEKKYLKCQDRLQKKCLRDEFKQCQHIFDKRLRFFKRRFNRGQGMHLEQLQTHNPQLFWSKISQIRPQKALKIPMEVKLPNGDLDNRIENVLKIWESEFTKLFSGDCIPSDLDEDALINIRKAKDVFERGMDQDGYPANQFLSGNLTLEEVKRAIDKAKNGKAAGVEGLYNEVLKTPKVLSTL